MYPDVNIAYGLNVNYIKHSYKASKGRRTNWSGGINAPITDDNKGNENFLVGTVTGVPINPYPNWHWGMVFDMNGSFVPIENLCDVTFS